MLGDRPNPIFWDSSNYAAIVVFCKDKQPHFGTTVAKLLYEIDGQLDDEFGLAGDGVQLDFSAKLVHYDMADNVEAQTGALARGLGGKERLENQLPVFLGYSRAAIGNGDANAVALHPGAYSHGALLRRCIDRIVQQVGPHLAQTYATGRERRQSGGKSFLDGQLLLAKLMAQDDQGALDAVVHIELMALRLVFIGVLLHRADQVGYPGNAFFDGSHQLHAGDERFHPVQRIG